MRARKTLLVALAATAFIVQAQASRADCTPPIPTAEERRAIPTTNINQAILSNAIVKQTNYYRCLRGLRALEPDPNLIAAAEIHAGNMARLNRLSHTLPISGARNLKDRFRAAGVDVTRMRAENVGTEYRMVFGLAPFLIRDADRCQFAYLATQQPIPAHTYGSLAQSLVKNLWESPSHRRNILNRQVDRIGAAADFTTSGRAPCGTYFVSQNFAG